MLFCLIYISITPFTLTSFHHQLHLQQTIHFLHMLQISFIRWPDLKLNKCSDPSKAHCVDYAHGSCSMKVFIMTSIATVLSQGTILKDVSTTGATLTKLFICVTEEVVADLWMNLLMQQLCWGYSWICWLVNCVHAACLLSEPAVKGWNMHDLCVYLQVCTEVLKTSDGFPSYMHVYVVQRTAFSSDLLRPMSWGNSGLLMISYLNSPQRQ